MDKLDLMIVAALTLLTPHRDIFEFRREMHFPERVEVGSIRAYTADGLFIIRVYEHGFVIMPPGVTVASVKFAETPDDLDAVLKAYFTAT